MAQALRPNSEVIPSATPVSAEMAVIRQEIRNRTIWTCYAMDRLFSCGKDRPMIFVSREIPIPLPLNEADYAFGDIREPRTSMDSSVQETGRLMTIEHFFTIIIQGTDLWATLSKWTADSARKKQYGCDDSPWNPDSEWNKINRDLEIWRGRQDP
jgi:hypothetical protein